MAASKTQLVGGAFQDADGNVLKNGYLIFELNQDEKVIDSNDLICAGIKVKITLDVDGNVDTATPQYIWGNDDLLPINSFYRVWGYSAEAQLVWGPNSQQVISGATFDVGTWTPGLLTNWSPQVTAPILETNNVLNGDQSLLNLKDGSNITITDDGSGDITIAATVPTVLTPYIDIVIWYPALTTTNQDLLHFEVRHGLSFGANFSGSKATTNTPATTDTTINVNKNGVTVGTIVYGAGATIGTLACTAFTCAIDDYLDFVVVTGDATLKNIAITLVATRTS